MHPWEDSQCEDVRPRALRAPKGDVRFGIGKHSLAWFAPFASYKKKPEFSSIRSIIRWSVCGCSADRFTMSLTSYALQPVAIGACGFSHSPVELYYLAA